MPLAIAILAVAMIAGLAVPTHGQTQQAKPADAPLHGKKLVQAYCAGCHGPDGNSTDPQYPKLAGQKASYLRSQLRAFSTGARKSDVMSGPASAISEAQIDELADYFSRQAIKPDEIKDAQLAQAGARLFRTPQRRAPACAACHNARGFGGAGHMMGRGGMMGGGMGMMMGNTALVPNLNGQHAAYIIAQLAAFANGTRRGTVMGPIAAGLNEKGRAAVAEYLSGLR